MRADNGSETQIIQARAWYWQRVSAILMTVFVAIHLAVMIYAIRDGLTAAEILGRTQGNWAFGTFYAMFVICCTVHVPIGLAKILEEWGGLRAPMAVGISRAFALIIFLMGIAAVWGVTV